MWQTDSPSRNFWVSRGNDLKAFSLLHMSFSTRFFDNSKGLGRWDVTISSTASANGSHWLQIANKCTLRSALEKSRSDILRPKVWVIFSIFCLSLNKNRSSKYSNVL